MREGEEKQGDARKSQGMPGDHSKESVKKKQKNKRNKKQCMTREQKAKQGKAR